MRVELLGASIDALNMGDAVERVAKMIAIGKPHRIITLNPEFLYRAQFERELMELVNRADLVTPDGVGIVWACRMAGYPAPERVTGIDLMLALIQKAKILKWRVYFLGAAPGVAEEAAKRISRDNPGLIVAGTHHGYFNESDERDLVVQIKETQPDLLFVALGAPKQERWIDRNVEDTGASAAVGVGGSLDVLAGLVRRAPPWALSLRVEWLYRLFSEPSRWRRQLVLPKFAWMVLRRYKFKRIDG